MKSLFTVCYSSHRYVSTNTFTPCRMLGYFCACAVAFGADFMICPWPCWDASVATWAKHKRELEVQVTRTFFSGFEHITTKYFSLVSISLIINIFFCSCLCSTCCCISVTLFSCISMCTLVDMGIHTCADTETCHEISSWDLHLL